MYASVRRYSIGSGSVEALARRIDGEFAPALHQEPGFLGYFAVVADEGILETISLFEAEDAARRSEELAARYVAENLTEFALTRIEVVGGPVVASRAAPAILDPSRPWLARRRRRGGPLPDAPVLVVGATGRTGRMVVARLLDEGVPVRALVRDTARARAMLGPDVKLFRGDLREPDTLAAPLAGAHAVVVATSGGADQPNSAVIVDYFGTADLVRQAVAAGVDLLVYVSSIHASRPDHYQDVEPTSLGWKARAEELVRDCGVPYCIVRAGWLTDGDEGRPLAFSQGDTGEGQLSRADLARLCVEVLRLDAARGKTFEVVAGHAAEPVPLAEAIAALEPDRRPARALSRSAR